jgi:hypothetical protein
MELTHTITLMEAIWTPFCLFGLLMASRLLSRAAGDLVVLRVSKINSIREYAAMTTLYLFATVCVIEFVFTLIGFVAMSLPNARVTTGGYVIGSLFICVTFALSIMLFLVERRRQVLLKKIRSFENMGGE